ncbi:pyrimidine reductase family protein [Actinoplanes sp. NBRC 101535]|uniref:pyrimidine reductase family protein n=1 Tax=Actinoplanes sp. NBRC 101535 TaxID=3032196 RepID=UPI0024A2620C|nr:pyrimidine reductase family protein [Actinoplanes sp. NBRC 101535]GLY04641.1 hypothetical protein Acsp01_50200 [Actinoplanes sp. NBRC 101535]
MVRLPAPQAGADAAGHRPTRPVTATPEWPATRDGLIALYPRIPEPTLRVNFIAGVDGALTVDGLSAGLQGPGDKEIFDGLRTVCDALIVGAGTIRAENYDALRLTPEARAWRTAHGLPEFPLMVIVSRSLNLDPGQLVFADAPVPPIVVTRPGVDAAHLKGVAEVVDDVDLAGMVTMLRDRGAAQLLCEGGPSLFGDLIAADLVDELCLTVSPLLAGGSAGRIAHGPDGPARRMALRHVLIREDMLFLRYARKFRTGRFPDPRASTC